MKICIQHMATRKFLRGVNTWVDGSEGARTFTTSIEAFRHCAANGLGGVNIIVDRGLARPLILIPVDLPGTESMPTAGFPVATVS
jgi:hypothetical protein